jgi:hypothetical protein
MPDRSKNTQDFEHVDLLAAEVVEILINHQGKLWINVNGKCLLRVSKPERITLLDDRKGDLKYD